ncbi:Hypothetical predicted protein [Marmota monax]|uniref:Uncharacterized protein n=1 Tax=Marmota monax TaxID=9995 RepID=A0A5E4BS09_MARMO|nr:hypothetical protein GHT09_008285 [Marmota monax]VTJ71402.1 Hypothetical predicted protein [Marmota monax]
MTLLIKKLKHLYVNRQGRNLQYNRNFDWYFGSKLKLYHHVDTGNSYLCGYLKIKGLTEALEDVVTLPLWFAASPYPEEVSQS